MATEPTLEQLSAYVDGEVDGPARSDLESHVATCSSCRERLEGIRQTVAAIRALPMEAPSRTFSIPVPQRAGAPFRWVRAAGWAGSAAAAVLVIALVGTRLLGGGPSTTASSTSSHISGGLGQGGEQAAAPAPAALDKQAYAQGGTVFSNHAAVQDRAQASRQLSVAADAGSYPTSGVMRVSVILQGSSSSAGAASQGLRLMLMQGGSGVVLADPVGASSYNGAPVFSGSYRLGDLALAQPKAGDYQLVATWVTPDGSGQVLQASITIRLTGN
ncbi:MAG: zf-HC2 domain-containing protein [Candidatus Dormibacter sp.]